MSTDATKAPNSSDLCFFFLFSSPGLSAKAPKEMGSNSAEKFYRIPEGKGPHSVGCTDLMTENAAEVSAGFTLFWI